MAGMFDDPKLDARWGQSATALPAGDGFEPAPPPAEFEGGLSGRPRPEGPVGQFGDRGFAAQRIRPGALDAGRLRQRINPQTGNAYSSYAEWAKVHMPDAFARSKAAPDFEPRPRPMASLEMEEGPGAGSGPQKFLSYEDRINPELMRERMNIVDGRR